MRQVLVAFIGLVLLGAACQPFAGPCEARDLPTYESTPVGTTPTRPTSDQPLVIGCHAGRAWGVAFSPDGRTLASSGNEDGTVSLWDVAGEREVGALQGPQGLLLEVAFSPDGSKLAVASRQEAVRVWGLPSKAVLADLSLSDTPWGMAFSPDGRSLAVSTRPKLEVIDLTDSRVRFSLESKGGRFADVAYSPDGSLLAIADAFNHEVFLLDPSDGRLESTLGPTQGANDAIAFDPRQPLLAAADEDGRIYLFNLQTGALVRSWQAQGDSINAIAFNPDATLLASVSGVLFQEVLQPKDTSLALWDVPSGDQHAVFKLSDRSVPGVAFSPDGRLVAEASFDGTVRVWAVP